MDKKEFFIKETRLLFNYLFVFWIILSILELFMPGFVIYYFNLNWLLGSVFILAFMKLFYARQN